jgi:hypothetical protein
VRSKIDRGILSHLLLLCIQPFLQFRTRATIVDAGRNDYGTTKVREHLEDFFFNAESHGYTSEI